MASDKVIGGPLDSGVIKQLDIRKELMSKNSRDDNTLRYLAARTGWVKLSSSVQVEGSSKTAEDYILIGGTYGRTGADTYKNYLGPTGKGFRPMPGITGVDIRAVNRFGLLKEATITYNCWDLFDLTNLEKLYMRPGFSVLLEWGHSIYYTTNSNIVTVPQTIKSFFTAGTTKEQLYSEIDQLKESSGQNYDAIYGFIKNFSWSFRADGGYDCTTTITSIGEIIESLQIDIDNPYSDATGVEQAVAKVDEPATAAKVVEEVKKKNPEKLAKEPTKLKYIVIGDSHVPYITQNSKRATYVGFEEGAKNLHYAGMPFTGLINAIRAYPVSDTVQVVVVSVGLDAGYSLSDDVTTLKVALGRAFPNADKLAIVKGSWGWGGTTNTTQAQIDTYYKKYTDAGFTVLAAAIGDMSKAKLKYRKAPYNGEIPSYTAIGKQIDTLPS